MDVMLFFLALSDLIRGAGDGGGGGGGGYRFLWRCSTSFSACAIVVTFGCLQVSSVVPGIKQPDHFNDKEDKNFCVVAAPFAALLCQVSASHKKKRKDSSA